MSSLFRSIPSVDEILQQVAGHKELSSIPRLMLKELINSYLDICRGEIKAGRINNAQQLSLEKIKPDLVNYLRRRSRPRFRHVINATGVVVHTNLGRSILPNAATEAVVRSCSKYSNLEFSLETGKRGSRYSLVEDLLCELTGAESGLVVNNNAAAVLLMLDTLAKDKEVIVSRGELVEIGGSFRIPEVMEKSGARLREVGATNRTHYRDYEQAIGPETAAIMKAHTSNYRIIGFHKEVELKDLVSLGHRYNLPVLEDLGSGNFFRFPEPTGLDEPVVPDVLRTGVSAVSFSGDKLLGGPQAGIILGKKDYMEKIKKNPLNRALRIDKMTLAALEGTLRLYKDPELAKEQIPTLHMILLKPSTLKNRASRLASRIKERLEEHFKIFTRSGISRVGGGASPEVDLASYLVCLSPRNLSLDRLRDLLLKTDPPLIGRIEQDCFCLDPRTLQRDELPLVVRALEQAVNRY